MYQYDCHINLPLTLNFTVFNGIVRLCLAHMSPALHKVTGVPQTTDLQKPVLPNQQSKKWKTVKLDTKTYLTHLLHVSTVKYWLVHWWAIHQGVWNMNLKLLLRKEFHSRIYFLQTILAVIYKVKTIVFIKDWEKKTYIRQWSCVIYVWLFFTVIGWDDRVDHVECDSETCTQTGGFLLSLPKTGQTHDEGDYLP